MRIRRNPLAALVLLSLGALPALAAEGTLPLAGGPELALPLPLPGAAGPELALPLPPSARAPGAPAGMTLEAVAMRDGSAAAGIVVERMRAGGPGEDEQGDDWVEIEYTIDRALEGGVRQVLRRRAVRLGHVVLMDPRSGELLAYVSTDPVAFPATRTYPMASLAKVVTAAAALRRVPEVALRGCRYVGSPYALDLPALEAPLAGGRVDPFWRALAISNNQCFARLAVHELGADAIFDELEGVGLLEAPAAGHAAGRFDSAVGPLGLGRLGAGLAGAFISPLAAVRLAALLAHGELVEPRWVRRMARSGGEPVGSIGPGAPHRVWSPQLADRLREILVSVTTRGTARRAFTAPTGAPLLGRVRVAGKTGTLSGADPDGLYRWFIGVAPADEPGIAISVLIVDGAEGGGAAPIAAEVLQQLLCDADRCAPEILASRLAPTRERRAAALRAPPPVAEDRSTVAAARPVAEEQPLDGIPRPIDVGGFELPRRLRERPASGRIVLLLELDPSGAVAGVEVDASDLPAFDAFVASAVRGWRFTPPTRGGVPVAARVRLPIPIQVE